MANANALTNAFELRIWCRASGGHSARMLVHTQTQATNVIDLVLVMVLILRDLISRLRNKTRRTPSLAWSGQKYESIYYQAP